MITEIELFRGPHRTLCFLQWYKFCAHFRDDCCWTEISDFRQFPHFFGDLYKEDLRLYIRFCTAQQRAENTRAELTSEERQSWGMWESSCMSAEPQELTLAALAPLGVSWKGFRIILPAWELGQSQPTAPPCSPASSGCFPPSQHPELPQSKKKTSKLSHDLLQLSVGLWEQGWERATTTLTHRGEQGKRQNRHPACVLLPSLQVSWTQFFCCYGLSWCLKIQDFLYIFFK